MGVGAAADPTAIASTDTTSAVPGLYALNFDANAPAPETASPEGLSLLAQFTKSLNILKAQLDAGQTPDPKLLKKLGDTADALAALLATPAPPAQIAADPVTPLDPLQTIEAAAATTPAVPLPENTKDQPVADPTTAPATPATDPAAVLLAAMSASTPIASTDPVKATTSPAPAAISPAAASQPLPAIARLAQQLSEIAAATPLPPEVSKRIDALVRKLDAAEGDPTTLAQLAAPGDSNAKALDKIVQQLLDTRPAAAPAAAAPKLSANAQLDIPAPIAAKTAPADQAAIPAAAPPPVSTSTPSTTTLKVASTTAVQGTDAPPVEKPKADPAIAVAATGPAADSATADAANAAQPAVQGIAGATAPAATTAARPLPAAYQPIANPINLGQMAFEMVRQVSQGQSRFTIRLDPPELGRVDVKMHVDATGTVNAKLTVERSETLDMFQRDQRSLEKALGQAGLDGAKTNLEFSLKQNPFAGMTGGDQRPSGGYGSGAGYASPTDEDASPVPAITLYRGTASAGGVNLFV